MNFVITQDIIIKRHYGWQWIYSINTERKSRCMKNRLDLEKYREETIKNIMLLYNSLNEIG